MAEPAPARKIGGQLSWLALAALIVFVQLLPLDTVPRGWAGPDLLLVVTLVWVARRPELAPAPIVALLFLFADLIHQRPPGLMAGLVLVVTEMVRSRSASLRQLPFFFEWFTAGLALAAIALGQRAILALTVTPQAPFGVMASQLAASILVYPAAVLAAHLVFGVNRPAPGEVDSLGHRL